MAESADALDSKSSSQKDCEFKSRRPYPAGRPTGPSWQVIDAGRWRPRYHGRVHKLPLLTLVLASACDRPSVASAQGDSGWACLSAEAAPDYLQGLGCWDDFAALASPPLDATIPGAQSSKTLVDRSDGDALYFTNAALYPYHWDFASALLSGSGLPIVGDQSSFNTTQYYTPDRRFLLGAVTRYEEADVWAYEIAPYDTADADMVAAAYRLIAASAWFGDDLYFHPASTQAEAVADTLPDDIKVITTAELYEGITYQPLNLGLSMGQLRFYTADELAASYVNYREIVVLDEVPLDLSIVAGTITVDFQTPLSHINVLAQNRGTPNMALRGAWDEPSLRDLEGSWVELEVGASTWSVREVTVAEADAWWEGHQPTPLEIGPMDVSWTELSDASDILVADDLGAALDTAIPRFGGKASHFAGLTRIGDPVVVPTAFAVPVYWYDQFMTDAGLWDQVDAMLADADFQADSAVRAERLAELQAAIVAAPLDPVFEELLSTKLETDFPDTRMKFRSSTTAEDLGDFTGAGLYTSAAGALDDPDSTVQDAVRTVWASVWGARAYEEREYYGIDHRLVGMAVLVHPSFEDEEANGVAITNNLFDSTGLQPAFYINSQQGEASVVEPETGVTSDQLLYYYDLPGQPIVYLDHSSLVADNQTVMSAAEIYLLGEQLSAIHSFYFEVYGDRSFYAMDTEFKLDRNLDESRVTIKQARPYPGRGEEE